MLPIQHLLPLRPYHHLGLTAWLRHLIGEVQHYERYITLDVPESGRISYQVNDFYHK